MTTQVLNLLWMNLDLPARPDPEDGTIRQPLPLEYVEKIRRVGAANPGADVLLWVDSRRQTEKQFAYLQAAIEEGLPNVHLKDLRSIPAYDSENLYNEPETDANWRSHGKNTLIWRQVDGAKILISLQGNYDQTFFADLDHAHLAINSEKAQTALKKHGIMIGTGGDHDYGVENQLWGFERRRLPFFQSWYETALKSAYESKQNAWYDFTEKVRKELHDGEKIPEKEIGFRQSNDGTEAEHTGHEWRKGSGNDGKPAVISKTELTRLFAARSQRLAAATEAPRTFTPANDYQVVAPAPAAAAF